MPLLNDAKELFYGTRRVEALHLNGMRIWPTTTTVPVYHQQFDSGNDGWLNTTDQPARWSPGKIISRGSDNLELWEGNYGISHVGAWRYIEFPTADLNLDNVTALSVLAVGKMVGTKSEIISWEESALQFDTYYWVEVRIDNTTVATLNLIDVGVVPETGQWIFSLDFVDMNTVLSGTICNLYCYLSIYGKLYTAGGQSTGTVVEAELSYDQITVVDQDYNPLTRLVPVR